MQKARDQKGATILMALLFLLLAAVLSGVILTAATNAARQMYLDRAAQQNYLTVSSAAELLRDSILSDSCTRITEHRQYQDEAGQTQTTSSETYQYHTGLMAPWLNAGIDTTAHSSALMIRGGSDTITIDVPTGSGKSLKSVQARFTMKETNTDAEARITVVLSLSESDAVADYCMTLTIRGRNTFESRTLTEEGENAYTTITTTKLVWSSAEITKGGAADA